MTRRGILGVALVAGAVGVAIGVMVPDGGGVARDPGSGASALDESPAALRARVEELKEELSDRERELRESRERALEAEEVLRGLVPSGDGAFPGGPGEGSGATGTGDAEGGSARAGAPFFGEEYSGALGDVNWRMVGGNLTGIVELLRTGAPLIARAEPLPAGMATRIQQLNSPVLAATIQVRDHLPGSGVSEKFTSAPFAANAIAAALDAAGLPLDDAQADRVLAAARDHLARDRKRIEGYGDGTWALERLLGEYELKERFYGDVFAVLSPAQRDALRPEETAGRVRLDLFSAAPLFGRRLSVFPFRDEEQLAAILEARVAKSLGLSRDQREALAGVYRPWVAGLPRDLLFADADVLDQRGMVATERAAEWTRRLLDLYRALAGREVLGEKQSAGLRGVSNVLVPLSAERIAAAK